MDALLREIRFLAYDVEGNPIYDNTVAGTLARKVQELDEQLSRGGTPPVDWYLR